MGHIFCNDPLNGLLSNDTYVIYADILQFDD